jgi:ribose 1,5-bisphosphokinase PhnN
MEYKKRQKRYTDNEVYLINILIRNRVDTKLWNGDTIVIDQSENLLTDIRNEYSEIVLRIFNNIEEERIAEQLHKLME